MTTRYDDLIDRLRQAARTDRPEPSVAGSYLEQVRSGAYSVSDRDVAELRVAGLSDDEIFELTVAAAVGAGLVRLDAALGTLA